MNWDNLIKEKGTIDLQKLPFYNIIFSERSKIQTVYGYKVILPVEPPDELCVNYSLPIEKQVFRKTWIPPDLAKWPKKEKDAFIDGEYNRRFNGYWYWIKGRKYYITGPFYFFLNYWHSTTAKELTYRFTDLEFYIMWMHVKYDPKCYGLLIAKCRQVGDTEKAICIIYEYATRVKKVKCPMQSIDETDIYENAYSRILHAHGEMIFYMKATNRGNSDPVDGLFFDYQRETLSKDKLKKNQVEHGVAQITNVEYEFPPLNSSIVYGPTKPHVFGTGTFGIYYMDEWGKWILADPLYTWNVVKQAMYNKITGEITGKSLFTSTVEDLKGGESLRIAKQFWKQSDPDKRNTQGETFSGVYRIFRGMIDAALPDHWGFPQQKLAMEKYKADIQSYMENGDIKGMIEYKRMNAITIEDVFQATNEGSQFDIEKLQKRLFYIQNNAPKSLYVRGNFKWKDEVKDTVVIWEPNSKGRWIVSKHPKDFGAEANAKVFGVIAPKPGNSNIFCTGVDPIDQKSVLEHEPSLMGVCVFAKLNQVLDGDETKYYQFTDESQGIRMGDPVDGGEHFISNRVCCTYLYRHADPIDCFEDLIMTLTYYGSDAIIEKNRQHALVTYMDMRRYELYRMDQGTNYKNYRGKTETDGVSATEGNIDAYFSFLTTLSCKWWNTIDHPDLLEQMLSTNYANKGKKDLAVACGWALYGAAMPQGRKIYIEQEKLTHFHEFYV